MDGFTHKRLLQVTWSCEIGFSKEMLIFILLAVKQLMELTLNHLLGESWSKISIHLT